MKKKILVRGPALTLSGYGVQTRLALRSLRKYEDYFDIYLIATPWGQCGWISQDNEERQWINALIHKTVFHQQKGGTYDLSLQVTIPNEWEPVAPCNIGYTAGIETDKISPEWVRRASYMDRIIVVSEHAKSGFDNTVIQARNPEGNIINVKNQIPVEVVGYSARDFEQDKETKIDFETDFNFLVVAQWSARKNLEATIKWFVEEFKDENVGLILKISVRNNSIMDRQHSELMLKELLNEYQDKKCKVYLLHGEMTSGEMSSVYHHPKVKALVSLSNGECWGLPLFEAACSGLPIICPNWGGQCDFINMPVRDKKTGKMKIKTMAGKVDYDLNQIQKPAVWPGVLEAGTRWSFAKQGSYKMRLRDVYKNIARYQSQAKKLQEHVLEKFSKENIYRKFAEFVAGEPLRKVETTDLPKLSIITSVYNGAEYLNSFFEDTVRQSYFSQSELILVHPKSSPTYEEEKKIIDKYRSQYENILYKPLEKDPGVYGCWNAAIKIADGEYITNANLDDRNSPLAFERHVRELYLNPEVSVVYSDSFITREPNELFEKNSSNGKKYCFEQFSKEAMLRGNQVHNRPTWRASLHEKYGLFDDNLKSAGDWEFFLRCAFGDFGGEKFKKINEILGLYYFSPKGLSTDPANNEWKQKEERAVFLKYQQKYIEEREALDTPSDSDKNEGASVEDIIL